MTDERCLPVGQWVAGGTPTRTKPFDVYVRDPCTGDYVVATVHEEQSDGMWSLPLEVVWNLGCIEPRTARAKGGTRALIKYLAEQADNAKKWLYAEVCSNNDAVVMRLLGEQGFTSPDSEYPKTMTREPK